MWKCNTSNYVQMYINISLVGQTFRGGGGGGRTFGNCHWVFVKHWNSIYVTSLIISCDNVGKILLFLTESFANVPWHLPSFCLRFHSARVCFLNT